MQDLGAMLNKWLPLQETTMAQPTWNPQALTELVGRNPALQKRLLDKFWVNAQTQVASILVATAANDAQEAARIAHMLKSAAFSVGAMALGAQCQAMETAGRADERDVCQRVAADLELALREVLEPIQKAIIALGAEKP